MPASGYGVYSPLTMAQIQALITPVFTLGTGLTVTGTANLGGLVEVTFSSAHGLTAGAVNYMLLAGVGGTTEANGLWAVNVVDATHVTLVGSAYVHAWTSGGTGQVLGHTNDVGSLTVTQVAQILDEVTRVPVQPLTNTLYQVFPVGGPTP